ncbi:hypothetical protein [Jannaschia helgolandensis]|uniref:hypothetical protein n=1 Tax=Jannaschia helgolandensis TaxID=188906 RepID=UPI0030D6DD38|tara:strand:+ start:911 stop:1183 length:273 start_codon:yes stop_codon:yes gene_type:complete
MHILIRGADAPTTRGLLSKPWPGKPNTYICQEANLIRTRTGDIRTRTGDLAGFTRTCAEDDLYIRAAPAIGRPEPGETSGPDYLLRDMLG